MSPSASRIVSTLAAASLAVGLAVVALVALRQPLALGDYAKVWGLKGRALARTGEMASLFRVDPSGEFSRPEYPPLWPALLAAWATAAGGWDDLVLTPLWPLLCLGAAFSAARLAQGPWHVRLLAGAAVALLPYYRDYPGYAEALLVVLLLLAVAEIDRLSTSRGAHVRLALFLTLAAWTKQEGALAALVVALGLVAFRRTRNDVVAGAATLFLGVAPWPLLVRWLDPEPPVRAYALASFSPASLVAAAGVAFREGVVPNAAWIAGAALLLGMAPGTRARRRPLLLGAALYGTGLLLSFLFTRISAAWIMLWSWDRLAFVPAAILLPVLAEAAVEAASDR